MSHKSVFSTDHHRGEKADCPACTPTSDGEVAHTHGTEDGPGLSCPERRDAFGLVGACQAWRYDVATWKPEAGPCPTCKGSTRRTIGMVCPTCGTDYGWDPTEPEDVEPLSLAALGDLIRETAETLDTLVDHAHAARRAAVGEEDGPLDQVAALRDIADRLGSAWAACVSAQRPAQALAAVKP